MKKKWLLLFLFILGCFAFYVWGYFTYSRKIFPYTFISKEKKILEKKEKINLAYFKKAETLIKSIDPYSLIKVNENNKDSVLEFINQTVFGDEILPQNIPTAVTIVDKRYNFKNLIRIEQITIYMAPNYKSIVYVFYPKKSINKVLLYHQGHEGDFIIGKKTIEYFVNQGFTVFALAMPTIGLNIPDIDEAISPDEILNNLYSIPVRVGHEQMKFLKNPLLYFIEPVIQCVNYATETLNITDISMVGISGGGWTTTLAGAIDNRIRNTFAVAGSYPIYIRILDRTSNSWGDFEQTYPGLFAHIDYLDLYVLSSSDNRKHYQILMKYDRCCFKNTWGYVYEKEVNRKNNELSHGEFIFYVDSIIRDHSIGQETLNYIYSQLKE